MTAAPAAPDRTMPPGRAAQLVEALGERARVCDIYDPLGAPVYDELVVGDTHEVRELLRALRPTIGPVLELAAGSGRLTVPFLAAGREVTALDLSADMLGLLRARIAALPRSVRRRATTVHADMTAFDLGREFGAVVLGTTSISLVDDAGRAGLFRSVRDHLATAGRFLLTTVDLASSAGPDEVETEVIGPHGVGYRLIEHWPAAGTHRTVTVLPADTSGDGPVTVCTSRIRALPVALLRDELTAAGWAVETVHPLPSPAWRHRSALLDVRVAA